MVSYLIKAMPRNCLSLFYLFILSFLSFEGRTNSIWRFPGYGSNQSYSRQPTPQPQQCQIRATSVTYTTAHCNARSLTHLVRPGIKPTLSQTLVRFITTEPQQESPLNFLLYKVLNNLNLEFGLWTIV